MDSDDPPISAAVLVTGATGFIGRALMAQLRRDGVRVIALARDLPKARAVLGADVQVVDRLQAIPAETRIDSGRQPGRRARARDALDGCAPA